MKNLKINELGITLVGLVVTIIILLILAGVSISQLTSSGLFAKANQAKINQRKAQYYEDINLDIYNEQIERTEKVKETVFITGLNDKISKREWVNSTIKCDEYFEEQEDDLKNTIIFIETKDGYEIIVDIDNSIPKATIREEYFQKVKEKSKIEYDANGGTGTVEIQEVRTGFYTILQSNSFERQYYSFVGWSKDKDENGEVYAEGSKFKVEEDTTLYAIWKKEIATITFDANSGTGTMESINVAKDTETQLPENTFEKEGYYFDSWNTKADGTGIKYTTSITISEEITLYAQWKKYCTITFNSNGGTGTMASVQVKQGDTITLKANAFNKQDYYFVNWNTKEDGTGTNYTTSITISEDITLYAIWNKFINSADIQSNPAKYYGKSVNYVANGINNWKVFYADSNGIFLIIGSFLQKGKVPVDKTGMTIAETYNCYWSGDITFQTKWSLKKDLFKATAFNLNSTHNASKHVSTLLNVDNWTEFVNTTYADYAIGSPTLEMFVSSWSDLYPNELFCNNTSTYGYYMGTSAKPQTVGVPRDTMKAKSGFKNKLYYPHANSYPSNCYGYWLASPGYKSSGMSDPTPVTTSNAVYLVWNYGEIFTGDGGRVSIRPVVHLLDGTKLMEQSDGSLKLY